MQNILIGFLIDLSLRLALTGLKFLARSTENELDDRIVREIEKLLRIAKMKGNF